MSVTRARIILGAGTAHAVTIPASGADSAVPYRRIPRVEMEARDEAARILAEARTEADALTSDARRLAESEAARAGEDARATEQAKFATLYVALRAEDENRADRDQDRAIALAVVLAERIVGHALALEPSLIASLAKRALTEARGARRVLIEASPDDVRPLRAHLGALAFPEGSVDVAENTSLARGDLCLHTDLGTLHARITPQLERLAQALRDALRRP